MSYVNADTIEGHPLSGSGQYQIPAPLYGSKPYQHRSSIGDPAFPGVAALTASLSVTYDVCRSVYVGTGGNVTLRLQNSSSVKFHNVDDGTMLPIRAIEVVSQSGDMDTTAENLVFIY